MKQGLFHKSPQCEEMRHLILCTGIGPQCMCLSYPLLLFRMYRDAHVLLLSTLTCLCYFQCTMICFSYAILLFRMYHDAYTYPFLPVLDISNVP